MSNQGIRSIGFDENKASHWGFEVLDFSSLKNRTDMDHSPFEFHRPDFYILFFVTGGKGTHFVDFKPVPYETGDLITIGMDQVHHFSPGESQGQLFIFTKEFLLQFLDQRESWKAIEVFSEFLSSPSIRPDEELSQEIEVLRRAIVEESRKQIDDFSSCIIRSYLQALLGKIYREKNRGSLEGGLSEDVKKLRNFQEALKARWNESRKVSFYANLLAMSAKSLNGITHRLHQQSAKVFIDEFCLLQIKRLLINTRLSVKEIAYTSGFNEPTNLNKYFRKLSGQSPEAFRKSQVQASVAKWPYSFRFSPFAPCGVAWNLLKISNPWNTSH